MSRTKYGNGDPIGLLCGCDGCNPSRINGVLCHEHGCPEAWRDAVRECNFCGDRFRPAGGNQRECKDCGSYEPSYRDEDEADDE